eukprot:CAMPEP_0183744714 /NCGR_PEP_ID=MMETSP0737-20130205/65871_1 /TAXON_ID=385413 /ORGANISM="Thalassiosira miniscula, Strain CCMP1093" /LENGTH=644 /DNA_ID=CAMNT_0025980365 /DNA_START=96 /DNA_END=2031 /DNA_ORIENTATION=+
MSDQSMSDGGDNHAEAEETTKLRISFVLSPSIRSQTQRDLLELPSEPIAVPSSIRKKGLSAVVNHLLDRKVPKEEDTSGSDSDGSNSDDDEAKLPAIPFDFLLQDKLLRLPLESAVRKEGLSTERALEIQYFPARLPPKKEGESESLPDWITAMDYCTGSGSGSGSSGMLFTGGADGVVRTFQGGNDSGGGSLKELTSVAAHTGSIQCLSSTSVIGDNCSKTLVATGSMDQTLVTHVYDDAKEDEAAAVLKLHAVYSGGHTNSMSSVALSTASGEKTIMASGDWDGGLALWSVPSTEDVGGEEVATEATTTSSKKRKGQKGATTTNKVNVREVKPLQSIKAHSSNISGLSWGYHGSTSSSSSSNATPTTLLISGGHTNSMSSVALTTASGEKTIMASGDWDGGLALWSVPSTEDVGDEEVVAEAASSKKRKGQRGRSTAANKVNVREVKPLQSIKAHSSNISGLSWGYHGSTSSSSSSNATPTTLLTGSWDHGLKVYDTHRMDCILALNGSRVVTSLARCSNSNVVATSSPDCTVRLWDMRTNGEGNGASVVGGGGGSGMDKSLRQSHKGWVSSVQWSPTDPFVLASTSHDGTLKVWDIRSSLPLHTAKAVNRKGEKALCLAFGDGIIYSGGSDCVVKQFACKI